ncbi:MAG TPA: baseplate J/gp47 family protein [Paracoccus sp. (in: a-proteobacteria)]|nr:baseplate J/gp47 family protein [Paracoccus sp. (in: a-proteobacteria)]
MSRREIDLSMLPLPDAVEPLDYETALDECKSVLVAMAPEVADVLALESEPLVKLLQVGAFRELLMRGRANDSVRAVMLALATGADLDQLVALLGVARQTIVEADPDADPPVAAVHEADAALRRRAQQSWEALTTAGTVGAYQYHALSADGRVRDVAVTRPQAGVVQVTILSHEARGVPSAGLLATVAAALENIRPLCDDVRVAAPVFVDFVVAASLSIPAGPGAAPALAAAREAVAAYVQDALAVGHIVRHGALLARLYQPGVEAVTLTAPLADIDPGRTGVARAPDITLTLEAV